MPGEKINREFLQAYAADDFGGIFASNLSIRLEMISINEAGVSPLVDVSVVLASEAFSPNFDWNSWGVFLVFRSYKGEDLR